MFRFGVKYAGCLAVIHFSFHFVLVCTVSFRTSYFIGMILTDKKTNQVTQTLNPLVSKTLHFIYLVFNIYFGTGEWGYLGQNF